MSHVPFGGTFVLWLGIFFGRCSTTTSLALRPRGCLFSFCLDPSARASKVQRRRIICLKQEKEASQKHPGVFLQGDLFVEGHFSHRRGSHANDRPNRSAPVARALDFLHSNIARDQVRLTTGPPDPLGTPDSSPLGLRLIRVRCPVARVPRSTFDLRSRCGLDWSDVA